MKKFDAIVDVVLKDIKQELHDTLGNNIGEIILFGSRSRGYADKDSDYDILVLVKRNTPSLEDQVDEVAYRMLERYGAVVTIFVEEMDIFEQEQHEPLFCNIRKEGAVL